MYQFLLPSRRVIFAVLFSAIGFGYFMTLIFSDPHPNDREIARAYDNAAGVEASQCRRITVSPYEGRPVPSLISQAPSLKAHICSFIDKQNHQVSSGVLIKSTAGKEWIAISHLAAYTDTKIGPPSTTLSSIPTEPAGPRLIPPPSIPHPTQNNPEPKVVPTLPLQDDGSFQNDGPFSGDDTSPKQESYPTQPAIKAHEDAIENEAQKN